MRKHIRMLSAILVACMLLSLCTGCITTDILQTYADTGNIIEEGIEQTQEQINRNMTAQWLAKNYPYDELIQEDLQDVFISYVGNEALVISRYHERSWASLGVHTTTYVVRLFEDKVCTAYSVHPMTPCPTGWRICKGAAAVDAAVDNAEGGALVELYPYLQDVYGYVTLRRIQSGEISYQEFTDSLIGGVFNQVVFSQYAGIMDGAIGDAKGAGVSLVGGAMGEMLETEDFLSAIYELGSAVGDAAENYRLSQDVYEEAYHYDPAVKLMEENWGTILAVMSEPLYKSLVSLNANQDTWTAVGKNDTFTMNNAKVELRLNGSTIQWRNKGKGKWADLQPLDKVKKDNVEVLLQVQGDQICWKYALTDTALVLSVAQQALHAQAKESLYPVQ